MPKKKKDSVLQPPYTFDTVWEELIDDENLEALVFSFLSLIFFAMSSTKYTELSLFMAIDRMALPYRRLDRDY